MAIRLGTRYRIKLTGTNGRTCASAKAHGSLRCARSFRALPPASDSPLNCSALITARPPDHATRAYALTRPRRCFHVPPLRSLAHSLRRQSESLRAAASPPDGLCCPHKNNNSTARARTPRVFAPALFPLSLRFFIPSQRYRGQDSDLPARNLSRENQAPTGKLNLKERIDAK